VASSHRVAQAQTYRHCDVAVRVWPVGPVDEKGRPPRRRYIPLRYKKPSIIRSKMIIHIVARDDLQQNLLFGFWTLSIPDEETETGIFYHAKSLTDTELRNLKWYAKTTKLPIIECAEFLEKLIWVGWETDFSLVTAWDFPFFASRLAYGYRKAKGTFRNGFAFTFGNGATRKRAGCNAIGDGRASESNHSETPIRLRSPKQRATGETLSQTC
jgi:hypothetical protein